MPGKGLRKRWIALGLALAAMAGLYLLNASWLAPPPRGRAVLIAQRGVAQVFDRKAIDNSSCTARHIPPPPRRRPPWTAGCWR